MYNIKKQSKIFIKFCKIPLFTIKHKDGFICYFLFNFILIYRKKSCFTHCYYFNSTVNFGDVLNENIFRFLKKNIICTKVEDCRIIAIGSLLQSLFKQKQLSIKRKILFYKKRPIIVWGSGFMFDIPSSSVAIFRLDIRAVRGYNSLKKLKELNVIKTTENIAIGDPGLLSKYLIDSSKINKKYDLGIIPHYIDKESPLLKKISVRSSTIIDIQQDPLEFLQQLAECRYVISSAMHGLIASDSLGIPNIRMVLSDNVVGGDYKYDDYYSAFGINNHDKINLNMQNFTDSDLIYIRDTYKINTRMVDKICKDLINAFPYEEI